MSFNSIFGQELAIRILQGAARNNALAHAYLFYGPESTGRKLTAETLARAVNCSASGPADACGVCPSCQRIARRAHPDVHPIEPEKTAGGREGWIRIEDIRELQRKLGFAPYEGRYKVAIIDGAERMNLQAANAFLKTLEEPPPDTILILIAENPFLLPATIRSRSQCVRFQPLRTECVLRILLGMSEVAPEEAELRAGFAQGQVRRAFDPQIEELNRHRGGMVELIREISLARADLIFAWSRQWGKKNDMALPVLELLMGLLRDMACLKAGWPSVLRNRDLAPELERAASGKSLAELLAMFDATRETHHAVSGNANLQLALENMCLRFCDAQAA